MRLAFLPGLLALAACEGAGAFGDYSSSTSVVAQLDAFHERMDEQDAKVTTGLQKLSADTKAEVASFTAAKAAELDVLLSNAKVKWQEKQLKSTVSANGELTDLSFALEAEKTYRVTARLRLRVDAPGTDGWVEVQVFDGSTQIGSMVLASEKSRPSYANVNGDFSFEIIRRMTDGRLRFMLTGASETESMDYVSGAGADRPEQRRSYVIVEELPLHVENDTW